MILSTPNLPMVILQIVTAISRMIALSMVSPLSLFFLVLTVLNPSSHCYPTLTVIGCPCSCH